LIVSLLLLLAFAKGWGFLGASFVVVSHGDVNEKNGGGCRRLSNLLPPCLLLPNENSGVNKKIVAKGV
jgi:hypothetical protein